MLFGERRSIGVFINETDRYFMDIVSKEVSREAERLGYNAIFFSTVGFRGSAIEYDRLECAMFDFAPLEKLDGLLIAPDTYQVHGFLESLLNQINTRVKCPVVTIRGRREGMSAIISDESEAIREMIKHVIEFHKAKHVCFMAGYEGHFDSDRRLECFYDEMEKHNLPIEENTMFRGNMYKEKMEEAYHCFFETGEHKPDAIICANDYMALGLMSMLEKKGVRVPEEVIVTGFDNIKDGELSIPSLTTVERDYNGMADAAVQLVDKLIDEYKETGSYTVQRISIPTKLALRESCGCLHNERQVYVSCNQYLSDQIIDYTRNLFWEKYFLISTGVCETIEDVHKLIADNMVNVRSLRDFYVCLYNENEKEPLQRISTEISDNVRLVYAFRDKEDMGILNTVFDHQDILPNELHSDEPQTIFIMLLHCGASSFGYTAVRYYANDIIDLFYHQWNVTIACVLQNVFNIMKVKEVSEKNYHNSITDPLTGLLNRRGFIETVNKLWEEKRITGESVAWIEADVNGLKYINDNFGHSEGDRAIRVMGEALSGALKDGNVAARIGGDEFAIFLRNTDKAGAEKYIEDVELILKQVNKIHDKKYVVSAAMGIYAPRFEESVDIDYCMQQSDIQMYVEKRRKKINGYAE